MSYGVWYDARQGDLGRVKEWIRQQPGLLDAIDTCHYNYNGLGMTPLMYACLQRHFELVQWLLDKGAAIDKRNRSGCTALQSAIFGIGAWDRGVRLLLERGADPAIANHRGVTPLMYASWTGRLKIVHLLLSHPRATATINHRERHGQTALWEACYGGHGVVARALLDSGADFAIANHSGITPMAIAKQDPPDCRISAEGRRVCVAALEVSSCLASAYALITTNRSDQLAEGRGAVLGMVAGGGAGLSAMEGPAGGRTARKRRGGGEGGAGWRGGEEEAGAGGLRGARAQGRPFRGADGVHVGEGVPSGEYPACWGSYRNQTVGMVGRCTLQ
jgi:hypothetical protein